MCAHGAQPHAAVPAFLQKMVLVFPQQVLCGVGTLEAGLAPSPHRVRVLTAQTTEWPTLKDLTYTNFSIIIYTLVE